MDRKAFYNLEYGVFMLSSRSGEKLGGCIINTCFQAASGPARLAISCINGNYTPELIRESSLFDLTVLDRTVSFDTIRHFGMQSGRDTDKFASFEHAVDENGIPYLTKEANAVFRCRVVSSQDLGSHPVGLRSDSGMSFEMERYLHRVNPDMTEEFGRVLELNADHKAVKAMAECMESDQEKAKSYAKLLYAQACLGAGLPLEDPSEYTDLVWSLMLG